MEKFINFPFFFFKKVFINVHVDTYFEVLLPKVNLIIYNDEIPTSNSRPLGIELGFSRVLFSNSSSQSTSNNRFRKSVEKCYELSKDLVDQNNTQKKFPHLINESCGSNHEDLLDVDLQLKMNHLAPCFKDLILNENLVYSRLNDLDAIKKQEEAWSASQGLFLKGLHKTSLNKSSGKDVWCLEMESMWIDFIVRSSSTGSSINQTDFIRNFSFKVYLLNVWDFYTSTAFLHSKGGKDQLNNKSNIHKAVHKLNEIENAKKERKSLQKLSKIIQLDLKNFDASKKDCFNNKMKKEKRSVSLSKASHVLKKQKECDFICKRVYSKLNVIADISDCIQLSLNHSKILFLLRLIDVIDLFTHQLKQDNEQTFKYRSNNNQNQNLLDSNNKKQQRSRIRSGNFDDWLIDMNLSSDEIDQEDDDLVSAIFLDKSDYPNHSSGEDEEIFSVNLALNVNSLQIDLEIEGSIELDDAENNNKKSLFTNSFSSASSSSSSSSNVNYKENAANNLDSLSASKRINKKFFTKKMNQGQFYAQIFPERSSKTKPIVSNSLQNFKKPPILLTLSFSIFKKFTASF